MGHMAVDDDNGNVRTFPVSLAADFFYPPVNAEDFSRLDPSFSSENTTPPAEPRPHHATQPSSLATPTDINFGSQSGDYLRGMSPSIHWKLLSHLCPLFYRRLLLHRSHSMMFQVQLSHWRRRKLFSAASTLTFIALRLQV
jgi:hypothetical protein